MPIIDTQEATQPQETIPKDFKVALIGDAEVGKSMYIRIFYADPWANPNVYQPTLGVEVHYALFDTSTGERVCFNVWDCSGSFGGLRDGYYIGSDCGIVMFDITNHASFEKAKKKYIEFRRVCANNLVVLCGNKVDLPISTSEPQVARQVSTTEAQKYADENGMVYFEISGKSRYNFEKPWLYLSRSLLGDDTIDFV